jgi:hypothetical protein
MSPPPSPAARQTPLAAAADRVPLPQTKLVLVTGKGGVGRSSTATAIAVDLAELGRSVALVHAIDAPPVAPPREAGSGLVVVPLDRDHALSNYLGDQLPGPFAAALRASRAFKLVTAATPGLAELLTIGELRRLADRYDHLVFDAPATGHLLALLDAPGRFERAAAVGPIARRASDLGRWIVDPRIVSVVTVTTGDGLAVSEMLELVDTLEGRLGHPPALVVANRLAPQSPAASELATVAEAHGGDPSTAPLVAAIDHVASRARSERAQLGRVTRRLGVPPVRALERPGDAVGSIAEALRADLEAVDLEAPASQPERRAAERRKGERRTIEPEERR